MSDPAAEPGGAAEVGGAAEAGRALEACWREDWARLVALVVGQFARPDLAEDAVGDAFEAAARRWPVDGVPTNPPAWLLTAARRRVLDRLRGEAVHRRKEPLMAMDDEMRAAAAAFDDPGAHLPDERLRLVLACCHPALAADDRVALTLRFVVGLPTAQIARLLLVQESAMAARLTRAKKRLAASGIPFSTPPPGRLAERLDVVATVLYLMFTAGYHPADEAARPGGAGPDAGGTAAGGPAPLRADLGDEAIRLARVLDELAPDRVVVRALLALMLLQHSRRDARFDGAGTLVLLPDQDRTLWHDDEITEGLTLLARAARPGAGADEVAITRQAREYLLQGLIAAEHATATTAEATRWPVIARRYAELESLTGSPVVRLARAVAVAEADGPAAGLALLDGLDAALPRHHRLPAVRGQLLARADRPAEAAAELRRALALAPGPAERAHLAALLTELQ